MSNLSERIAALNARLQGMPRTPKRIADNGGLIRSGQLWRVRHEEGLDGLTWVALVEDVQEDGRIMIVPCFRWLELAGPDDVLIPAELAGAPLVASFELEASLHANALSACEERLSEDGIEYVSAARRAKSDEQARNGFHWGIAYMGKHGVRQDWHDEIRSTLKSMQGVVLGDGDLGVKRTGFQLVDYPPFSVYEPCFKFSEEEELKAADTGEEWTLCVSVVETPDGHGGFKPQAHRKYHAKKLRYDTIRPGINEGLCCEWWVEGEVAARQALVYAWGVEHAIGIAEATPQDGGLLLNLSSACLPKDASAIQSPSRLCLVLKA